MIFWAWLIITFIGGLSAGVVLGIRLEFYYKRNFVQSLASKGALDKSALLENYRRELANWMIWRDPDRYLNFYKKLHESIEMLRVSSKKTQRERFSELNEKYAEDGYDLLSVREHVLYSDALNATSIDDVEEHFKSIAEYMALKNANDSDWLHSSTSIRDLEHLEEYVPRIKDTKLKMRLKSAVLEYSAYREGKRMESGWLPVDAHVYENDRFSVRSVENDGELVWGYHFQDTNEYGLHTVFNDSGTRYVGYYRSDPKFKEKIWLNCLPEDSYP